jgi:dGTPase
MELAKYACIDGGGRCHQEEVLNINHSDDWRSDFQRDRDRIVHSVAFRRLEYKTQVFVNHVGDHYRTRLTHSLEVAQIAKSIARALYLNEDLTEAIALAHDLGHPPFGHAGEEALDAAASAFDGFDHNAHTIKILTKLEQRYAEFDGLNLSKTTLDGIIKHNGPITTFKKSYKPIQELIVVMGIDPTNFPSLESQVAAISDDIAYCNHDLDDGIRAKMISISDLQELDFLWKIYQEVQKQYPRADQNRLVHEAIRRLIRHMVGDVIAESKRRMKEQAIATLEDVQNSKNYLVEFSAEMDSFRKELKAFLMRKVYRNYQVNRMTIKGSKVITELFETFFAHPACLPPEWYAKVPKGKGHDEAMKVEVIVDYIAGMTDRYALVERNNII